MKTYYINEMANELRLYQWSVEAEDEKKAEQLFINGKAHLDDITTKDCLHSTWEIEEAE